MLANLSIIPCIPASDMDRARRFYGDTLGMKSSFDMEGGIAFESGDSRVFVYETPSAGQAKHTLATWIVSDLDAEMADLRSRGITFEEYDLPGIKTVNGVADASGMRGAWFKDSEGNILGLGEMPAT